MNAPRPSSINRLIFAIIVLSYYEAKEAATQSSLSAITTDFITRNTFNHGNLLQNISKKIWKNRYFVNQFLDDAVMYLIKKYCFILQGPKVMLFGIKL